VDNSELKKFVAVQWILVLLCFGIMWMNRAEAEEAGQCLEQFVVFDNAGILEMCRHDQLFITASGEKFWCGKVKYL
jgi:hypothetical protein